MSADRTRVILADSSLAVERAFQRGLPRDVRIVTSSPFLARSKDLHVQELEKDISSKKILELAESSLGLSTRIYKELMSSEMKAYALLAALRIQQLQKLVYKAMGLRREYFTQPVTVLELRSENAALNYLYTLPWKRILCSNPDLEVISISLSELEVPAVGGEPRRISPFGASRPRLEHFFLRLIMRIWRELPVTTPRGSILLYKSNDLLKEVSLAMGLKGFSVRSLGGISPDSITISSRTKREIKERLCPIVRQHLGDWVLPMAIEPLMALYTEDLLKAISAFEGYIGGWHRQMDSLGRFRVRAVLTNFPAKPDCMALAKVCRERGILCVSAQHGNAREFSAMHRSSMATYENNVADLVFTFNEEAARLANEGNPFRVGRCVSIGGPSRFRHLRGHRKHKPGLHPPVIYVSNMLYMGNVQMVHAGGPDHFRAEFDVSMVKEVLARIPHRVLFKARPSYDAPRYLDPDPIKECARSRPNIELYEGDTNLVYMLANHRVVVSSVCSSTLGLCLASDLPLVFIDIPYIGPMKEGVREEFAEAAFLFDASSPRLHRDLKDFLSQPLDHVEALWTEKAAARRKFMEKYVAAETMAAGARGAEELERVLAEPSDICP